MLHVNVYATNAGNFLITYYEYPNLRYSDPPRIELTVHLASLQLLFLNSVASTAPRCESSFWRQSTPIAWKKQNEQTPKSNGDWFNWQRYCRQSDLTLTL